jgi:hypothetical protein
MPNPIAIQTEIRVADVLALLNEGETRWYLCYNIARLLEPQIRELLAVPASVEYFKSGFEHYCVIDDKFNRDAFEGGIMKQISEWTMRYYGTAVANHTEISGLGYDRGGMDSRAIRADILSRVLADDPDAVFRIEC